MCKIIACEMCGKDLGEIVEGRIRKGVTYYCKECDADIDDLSILLIARDTIVLDMIYEQMLWFIF